jgi:hypothetical protein
VEASELEAYIARMYDQTREFVSTHRFGRAEDDPAPTSPAGAGDERRATLASGPAAQQREGHEQDRAHP